MHGCLKLFRQKVEVYRAALIKCTLSTLHLEHVSILIFNLLLHLGFSIVLVFIDFDIKTVYADSFLVHGISLDRSEVRVFEYGVEFAWAIWNMGRRDGHAGTHDL